MNSFFLWSSALGFFMGIIWLIVSAIGLSLLIGHVMPLLTETKDNLQDLGDLAANTVGRASDTMEIIEMRVTQTMGEATGAGRLVTKQALSLGSLLVGGYMAIRIGGMLRSQFKRHDRQDKKHKGKRHRFH